MSTKNILMIARHKKIEALRMASGLTLLDDEVSVLVEGELENSEAADEQLEALEYSDVPVTRLENADNQADVMATAISKADVVYVL
ncbi:MAG: hypothetical protein PF495_19995 [Spirochaetales bacterium]|jgi:hypothetical protein|nr:hypothetical protein [Spirochaetales bacterium]